jgi:sulfide:quinone oxidoreductase
MSIQFRQLSACFSVAGQIDVAQLEQIAAAGFRSLICVRPDEEDGGQHASSKQLASQAAAIGLAFSYLPVAKGTRGEEQASAMRHALATLPAPVFAYCLSGGRAANLFSLVQMPEPAAATESENPEPFARLACGVSSASPAPADDARFDIVIVGGGAAGIGVAASLLRREPGLQLAIIEPASTHYYQPAWTLVGAGAYDMRKTARPVAELLPAGASLLPHAASYFDADARVVGVSNGARIGYQQLIVCPGLQLAWDKIEGLEETLGRNGVSSNYRYDLAPYTWELVSALRRGKAIFTQPAMPIKCAGAPQKAMYLSCDHWLRRGVLRDIEVEFCNAGGALFGVGAFVPALMNYVRKYDAQLSFSSNLVRVDGQRKLAWFDVKDAEGNTQRVEKSFDFLHVVPPQVSPDVVRNSPLADAAGWCDVDHATLQHPRYANVFSLGDVCSAPNAKTVAAVRKQIVVVAENLLALRKGLPLPKRYDGYGACPLTVEKGKIVLAEFGYGGKLLPTFPLDPTIARRSAWYLKTSVLPTVYWQLMLKGREWLTATSV